MKFIEWCGLLEIGHPTIDAQHQELFSIINTFHDQLAAGQPSHLSVQTLNRLIAFSQKHFADEEVISERFGFPDHKRNRHKQIHEKLVHDIFELHEEITRSESIDLESISQFLTNWIILHILIEDNGYKPYLTDQTVT